MCRCGWVGGWVGVGVGGWVCRGCVGGWVCVEGVWVCRCAHGWVGGCRGGVGV